MLKIIMGRAGTGKSQTVLDTIAKESASRPQILLVPEHTSHEAELDVCRLLGDRACAACEVLSFHTLSGRILCEMGGAADAVLDNGGKLLTLRCCLEELSMELTVFRQPSRRVSFLEQLCALFDEFYAYSVTPQTLLQQVEALEDTDKLRDIALLFGAYDRKLHSLTCDSRSRMQKMADAVGESRYFDGKDVYLDGFSFFNVLEEKAVARALRRANSVTVTLLGDKHDGTLFSNAARARDRLARLGRENGCEVHIIYRTAGRGGALGHLEGHFFGTDAAYEGAADALEVYEASAPLQEVEYVCSRIRDLARQGVRYRDMAVAARNMTLYGPLIQRVFRRDDVPVYVSRRSDILDKPVITSLLAAVDAVTGGMEYDDVFRCLKTGLAGITPAECDLLENYCVRWQLRGSMWLREGPWTANPEGYNLDMTPARCAVLDAVNGIREKVRPAFAALHEGLKGSAPARDKAKNLYIFAERLGVPAALEARTRALLEAGQVQSAEEYRQLWDIFCGVLDQFVDILGDTHLGGEEFARLLRLTLTQYSVGTIPATLDQVKVSEITRNDRHSVRYLFLLGATDDVLPTVPTSQGILDRDDRASLRRQDIHLSDESFDALDNEMQNIYACIAQPTEKLCVSYPAAGSEGEEKRRSFVVERILQLFPALCVRREDGAYRLKTMAGALGAAGEGNGALWEQFASMEACRSALDAMARAREMRRGNLSPEAVRSLYGASVSMSASRMDKIKSCHFAYFMEYGLKAKERTAAGFDAPEIGTFVHYLLENVNREVKDLGGYRSVSDEELRTMVHRYCDIYADEMIDGYREKSARFRYLFTRLRKTAYEIVLHMAEEMRASDFTPVAFELDFGPHGTLPAITVTQGDTTLAVGGKVDRVDGWLHEGKLYLRVVDYKTGKKAFDLADIRYGLNVQMLLYLFALGDHGEEHFGYPIVPAGVLYHPARDVILPKDRSITPEALEKSLQKELRRSGMVLRDAQVLRAMEHSALESPCFLPLNVSKDGTLSGSLATAEQLGRLSRYVDKLLGDIAAEIGRGTIDADPCLRGNQSPCDYCPFFAACGFDERSDKYRYVRPTKPEEFWQHVEKATKEVPHG